jgi:hypothetical protein
MTQGSVSRFRLKADVGTGEATITRIGRYEEADTGYTTPCWLWLQKKDRRGYGLKQIKRVTWTAHRWAYTVLVGPVPRDLDLDHLCRVKGCVNPDHMEPVTQSVNMLRSYAARRAAA